MNDSTAETAPATASAQNQPAHHPATADGIPPGWDYNPASWKQRLPIVLLAFIGGIAAFYLTLFQWGVVKTIWDPFFSGGPEYASGSAKILHSPTSKIFPFPFTDGFLGFLGYVGDAVTGLIGGTRRWRTMPWIVILFGILVGPLGAISILLVMIQPLVYDTFCTICLFTALVSVLMIGPALDEMLASLQYMKRVRANGLPFWRYFWGRGDQQLLEDPPPGKDGHVKPVRTMSPAQASLFDASPKAESWIASSAQWVVAAVGIYLMAAPAIWDFSGAAADVDRVIGPLVGSFALIAAWECTRNVRWINLVFVAVLVLLALSPWPVATPGGAIVSDLIAAVLIAALTLLPYPPIGRFGGGWVWMFPGRPKAA